MVLSMEPNLWSLEKELEIRELENCVESGFAMSVMVVLCLGLLCKQPSDMDTGKIC